MHIGGFFGGGETCRRLRPNLRDDDLIGVVCSLDIWSFKNSTGDSNMRAKLKHTDPSLFHSLYRETEDLGLTCLRLQLHVV